MAKKGERKAQKRLSVNRMTPIRRKDSAWVFKTIPGPHSKKTSVPLGVIVRDVLGVARNAKEARFVLNNGSVLVDGRKRKRPQFPVGLFDVVSVGEKHYRAVLDENGRLSLREAKKTESVFKLCKVVGKKAFGKGLFQLHTSDGRSFFEKNNSIKPGDTLQIGLPEQVVREFFKLEKGNSVFVIDGKRSGSVGKIIRVIPGTMARERIVVLAPEEGNEFQTAERNVFVVGKEKPVIGVSA